MRRAKTLAEYQATAMLLGYQYSRIVHVFFGTNRHYLDPDTMEPIERHETGARYSKNVDDTFADGMSVAIGGGNVPAKD